MVMETKQPGTTPSKVFARLLLAHTTVFADREPADECTSPVQLC